MSLHIDIASNSTYDRGVLLSLYQTRLSVAKVTELPQANDPRFSGTNAPTSLRVVRRVYLTTTRCTPTQHDATYTNEQQRSHFQGLLLEESTKTSLLPPQEEDSTQAPVSGARWSR